MKCTRLVSFALLSMLGAVGVSRAATPHEGLWIGGIWGSREPLFLRVTLGGEGKTAAGRADFPEKNEWSILLQHVTLADRRVTFDIPAVGASLSFNGVLDGDRIAGSVQQGAGSASFELMRASIAEDPAFERIAGDYEFGPGEIVLVYRSLQGPAYVDYRTGRTGLLFRLADGRYVAGPSLLTGFPVEITIAFERDAAGTGVAMAWTGKRGTQRAERRQLYRTEPAQFSSQGASLAGTLMLPPGPGPHPAVVMIHGSGPATRDVFLPVADVLVRNGVAVLIHDKRGTGASTGDFNRADFSDLSDDALAGVAWLAVHPEVNARQIGLHGFSLGSWVAPLAASRSPQVAFVIVEAAPATTPAEHERQRVGRQMRADGQPNAAIAKATAFMDRKFKVGRTGQGWDDLRKQMQQGEREGWLPYVNAPPSIENLRWNWEHILSYDPRPALEALRCPVLALYGSRDTTVSPAVHLARMRDALSRSASPDATIRELPGANHHFYAAHTGGPSEVSGLHGFVDGYFDARVEWLRERVDAAPAFADAPQGSFR